VGILAANIQLIPGARADDGKLDVLVASPRTARDWVRLTTQVLTRRRREDAQLDRLTGRRVTINVEERDHYQVDGDTVGECNTMIAEVLPGALTLRVPQTARVITAASGVAEPGTNGEAPEPAARSGAASRRVRR
jgi:diacylglycerol kinase family enzyme